MWRKLRASVNLEHFKFHGVRHTVGTKLAREKFHFLDFNDMINFVLDKFDDSPAFLEEIANRYEYILVDEYQDTNNSQNSSCLINT